jgi:hypothetical protein
MAVRTAWLHKGNLMQEVARLRRAAFLGDVFGDCTLTFKVFLDDRVNPADKWHWTPTSSNGADGDHNPTALGDETEEDAGLGGSGLLGDAFATAWGLTQVRTRTLNTRKRMRHGAQKCSRFSIEIRDGGPNNEGVGLTEIALEIGARGGLTRLPARAHTA